MKDSPQRVLVACEFSGIIREAFRRQGCDAWSCDLLETEIPSRFHVQADVFEFIEKSDSWDLMVAHPPCTFLAVSGARWFKKRQTEQKEALDFVKKLMDVDIPHICIENPISIISTKIRKPDQIIQPWMFGHGETKSTCLWLKNLPKLQPTNIVDGRDGRVWREAPDVDRWKKRSRTYSGIGEAMASQWSNLKDSK
jgi:hypothetical protein